MSEVNNEQEKVTFTPEQQAVFDNAVAEERRAGEARTEALRVEAASRIQSLTGSPNPDDYLQKRIDKATKDAARRAALDSVFLNSREAAALGKNDIEKLGLSTAATAPHPGALFPVRVQ